MARLTKDGKLEIRLVPPITQKLLAENEEFQKQIRRGLNTSAVHPALINRARSILKAEEIKHLMLGLFAERRAAMKAGKPELVEQTEAQLNRLTEKLAGHLFDAGEFELALKATRSKKMRAVVREHLKAAEIDDDEWSCGHKKWFSYDGQRHPNYFRERDLWSPRHGRVVSVIRCNECGFRNIRPLPEDLAEMSRLREEARKGARGAKGK
jgi:hypothetical protein